MSTGYPTANIDLFSSGLQVRGLPENTIEPVDNCRTGRGESYLEVRLVEASWGNKTMRTPNPLREILESTLLHEEPLMDTEWPAQDQELLVRALPNQVAFDRALLRP